MKKTRDAIILNKKSNLFRLLALVLVVFSCAQPRTGFREPAGLKKVPPDSSWSRNVARPVQSLSAAGRVSLEGAANLPFSMLLRGDSLQLSLRSRVGTALGQLLLTPDSVYLYQPAENTLEIAAIGTLSPDGLLLAGLNLRTILTNTAPGQRVTDQSENRAFLKQTFENRHMWIIRKADSAVVFRTLDTLGTAVSMLRFDLQKKYPVEFEITSPSLEMPIFARVTSISDPKPGAAFRTRFPAKTVILRQ